MDFDESKDYSSLGWVMFMNDYSDVKIDWQEPREIDDILLETENRNDYAASQEVTELNDDEFSN